MAKDPNVTRYQVDLAFCTDPADGSETAEDIKDAAIDIARRRRRIRRGNAFQAPEFLNWRAEYTDRGILVTCTRHE
jgi:hypothetical protein